MASYAFHDFALDVEAKGPGLALDLDRLLEGLSFKRIDSARNGQTLRLTVASSGHPPPIPAAAREAFRAEGFAVLENGCEFFVTDGESLFHLRPEHGDGTAHLADSFHTKPALLQGNFWAYGLMKLFRQKGLYALHGAGLVSPANAGVVITGPCGCGKSTLSIGLIRAGWGYLSDDALLLRNVNHTVELLALRKSFYVDEDNAQRYPDLSPGAVVPDNAGGQRRQLALHRSHPDQYAPQVTASVLVFPTIVPQATSTLKLLTGAAALTKLLAESGGQLFDRSSMSPHLEILKRLIQQTRTFELQSGQDLHRDPVETGHTSHGFGRLAAMGRIVIELTNRCNLRCRHCYEGRHGGNADLSLTLLDKILRDANQHGFNELAFTGGEPTTHRQFFEVIERSTQAGYRFGFVSNGWNFPKIYQRLLPCRDLLTSITFSLDGAKEATHDTLRGKGSFRRLLKAMSICVAKDIPFSINTVVTSLNCDQLDELVALAMPLGSQGVRFGHYIESGREDSIGLRLTADARRRSEATIWQLRDEAPIPVAMAPGYVTEALFPCAPLNLEEFNIDWQGNVGKCCHLSGFGETRPTSDIAGNLNDISFSEAVDRLKRENDVFRRDKAIDQASRAFCDEEYSPCEYCCRHYRKGRFVPPTASLAVEIQPPNRHYNSTHPATLEDNPMLIASNRATPDSDVIVTELDGEAVLLHLETKLYFSLNTTGVAIWKLLEEDLTLGQIGERLLQEYDVPPDKAQQCVLDLVGQLNDEKLVSVTHD